MATLVTPTDKAEKVEKKNPPVTDEKLERKQRPRTDEKFKIFSGTANEPLADEVCHFLGMQRGQAQVTRFADGECYVQIQENVRGADVFVMQPTCRTYGGRGVTGVDEHLMELLLMIDALKRASARRITAVVPYFGYARQDRKDKPRSPISSKLVADLLTTAGAHRALIVDLHTPQLQGFFNIPVDPLSALPLLADYFRKPEFANAAIVSPDVGRASMAGRYAELLNLPLVVMHKRRSSFDATETTHVVGDIVGRRPIVIDDVMAGGSVLKQVDALYANGATGKSYFAVTHPVLLPTALARLDADERIEKLVVGNTIPVPPEKRHPKLEVLSVAPLLADVIYRIYKGNSISEKLVLA